MANRLEFSRKTKAVIIARAAGKCEAPDCDKDSKVKGLCWAHYMRNRRHGDPTAGTTGRGAASAFLASIPDEGVGCIFWPFARDIHGSAKLTNHGNGSNYVCRRICERKHGARGQEFQAAHSCGNGHLGCVSPWHLSWKTRPENEADKIGHGTYGRKLTEAQVIEIRSLYPTLKKREIADRFGVTRQAIDWIVERKGWTHV